MNRRKVIEFCLSFPAVYEDYPFGPPDEADAWTAMRHLGNKKTFAFIYERKGLCVNLKCSPVEADFLRHMYEGVTPAYHMNKVHWNTVRLDSDVPWESLCDMIENSFQITRPTPKSKR